MKKLLAILSLLALIGLIASPAMAAELGAPLAQAKPTATPSPAASPTLPPTYTPLPTYTPMPTYTPLPTYTPPPSATPTRQPTFTPQPTYTPYPTYTPLAAALPTVPPLPTMPPLPTLVPPESGLQFGDEGGQIVFGGQYVLPAEERLDSDLVVFGGTATLERDSRVKGSVVVIGGSADIAGRVDGDVVVVGGTAYLRRGAEIRQDVLHVGGSIQKEEGAVVRGEERSGPPIVVPSVRPFVRFWRMPLEWNFDLFGTLADVFGAFMSALVMVVLAALVAALLPIPTTRAMRTMAEEPLPSWLMGMVSFILAGLLLAAWTVISAILVIVCVGLLGLVLVPVFAVAFAAACLYGWFVAGTLIGQRLVDMLNVRGATLVGAAALGVGLISLLSSIPCLGWLITIVLAPAGLGAVILTRFGTQPYTPGATPRRPAPPAPPVPPPPPGMLESPEAAVLDEAGLAAERQSPGELPLPEADASEIDVPEDIVADVLEAQAPEIPAPLEVEPAQEDAPSSAPEEVAPDAPPEEAD
ncbi:MAG: hypothetical protein JW850_06930 [Thermoflexales bacterium]|nr:hypothetical protein [Thermoflexales bacterium]